MKLLIFAGLTSVLLAVLTAAVAAVGMAAATDDLPEPYVDVAVEIEVHDEEPAISPKMNVFVRNLGTATAYDVEVVVAAITDGGVRRQLELIPTTLENLRYGQYSSNFEGFWNAETSTLVLPQLEAGSQEDLWFTFFRGSRRFETFGWLAEVSVRGSYESATKMYNNVAREWVVQRGANLADPAEPNYSLSMTSSDHAIAADGIQSADFIVTARFDQPPGQRPAGRKSAMDARVVMEFSPGLQVDDDAATFALETSPFNLKQVSDLSYEAGEFRIGQTLDGEEFKMTLPVRVATGASSTDPLCVTATLTAQPLTGFGLFRDDATDNMAKECWGPAPAGEPEVLASGTADLFTWYDCVGRSAPPCDRKDDGDATTNDDLQLVAFAGAAAEDFGIFQPSQIVVHTPDPAGRAVNKTGALVWSTGFENWNVCTAVDKNCLPGNRDRPGTIVRHITSWLDLRTVTDGSETPPDVDRWGTPDTTYPDWERGYLKVEMSGPGKMAPWDSSSSGPTSQWGSSDATYESNIWITSSNKHLGFFDAFYIEFSTLGTYELTATIRTPYDDDVTDTTPGVEHSDTESYTFHVGPLADLSVASGASPHVAANRNALTIFAANNGPANTADAKVMIALPSGTQVEEPVASEGTYANGVWTLPGLKSRDYRRSQGKPEEATLSLILKEGGGAPKEPATASISLTDNAYTVCIDSDRNTLAHTNRADCKADEDTTDDWYAGVCVQDSDQTVNTTATHDTQTECEALTGHTWTANVCANEDGKVIAGRTEPECDGWHTGTVYDPPANNTAKIMVAEGTGVGPDIPASVTTQTGTTTTVMWDEVEHLHGLPVARYEVQWLGSEWTTLGHAEIANEYWDATPTGRRAYRVRAMNAAGVAGPWSLSSVQVPVGSAGSPVNLRTEADGNNAIDVSWDSPEDIGGSPITGYRVEWSADPEAGRWSGANTTELTYKHRSLQTGGIWYYRVAARNSGGLGLWSDPVQGKTASGTPDAPGNFRATTLSDYEIELTWNEPKDNGEPITGYQLERSRDGSADSWSQRGTPGADATAHTDSSLDANTRYYYRVRAVNSVGAGAWSRSVSSMTQLTPPDAPSLTSVEADGPNAIIVTWAEPWYLGDLPVTQYQVQWAKDQYSEIWRGPQTLSGSARSWRHTGLKPDETWYYQVRASNGGGRWSVWSYISAATTASDNAPRAVGGLNAQFDKDLYQVNLTWNDLSGSETPFGYELQRSEDGNDWDTLRSDPTCDAGKCAYADTDLWPAAKLYYRIRASSGEDAGPWSSSRSVSVPADPPDAPRYRWVEADGSNHIYFEWTAPYYDGGAAITGYRLLWCRALDGADENPCEVEESNSPADPPGYSRISLSASARSYTHSVSPGYNYFYLVRATNGGNRWSEWEEYDITGYVRTYAGVPAAPSLTARAVDANQIKLTWSRPSSSGSEISEYWLYIYENGEDLYDWDNILDILRVPGDRTEWTVGDLSPETTRHFRIRALNDNGEGKYSALRQATTPSG